MFDPSSGIVRVGGVDVKKLDLSALRGYIGCVPQEAFLFSDTLENNIKFGNAEATQSEIEEAAKNAAVHDSIMDFSMGYQTRVGERGVSLSGGQKQRMSIARALIKKPKILLLDDSLSAVDTQTEELILNNLENITNDITMIVVCHRISSAKNADYILVLNEGKVDQFGTHKTLIKEPGHYADLHQKQL